MKHRRRLWVPGENGRTPERRIVALPGRFDAGLSLRLSAPLPNRRNAYSGGPHLRVPQGLQDIARGLERPAGRRRAPQDAPEASQGASERLVARVSSPASDFAALGPLDAVERAMEMIAGDRSPPFTDPRMRNTQIL